MTDRRRSAPATLRNREPILAVLRRMLPESGLALEIASGTGEHAAFFAGALPGLRWQPSDPDPAALDSIAAWTDGVDTVLPPLSLDALAEAWPVARAQAIVCINMIHISPWAATEGLMRGAARVLDPGAPLYLYGPYRREGRHTAPSNAAFDADLKARNLGWGVRDLEAVIAEAERNGLAFEDVVEMPANNLSVVLRRGG